MSKKLVIVDLSSFIFRAFYAIRPLHSPEGTPTNAVYGVYSMITKLIAERKPDALILARDHARASFRKDIYPEYKSNRSAPPEDLIPQFGLIEELINLMNIPSIIIEKYEADDIIGSLVCQWKNEFEEIFVATGDKDLMQFVGDNVYLLDTKLDKVYGAQEVKEKMGVRPDQIVDYLSLLGDSSDNIPGVRGIGAKGASKLLEEYDSLDRVIKHKDEISNKRAKKALDEYLDDAYLSRRLVEIVTDLELPFDPEEIHYNFKVTPALIDFFKKLGFKSQVIKLENLLKNQADANTTEGTENTEIKYIVHIVRTQEQLNDLEKRLESIKLISLNTVYSNQAKNIFQEDLLGLALCLVPNEYYFIPSFYATNNLQNSSFKDCQMGHKDYDDFLFFILNNDGLDIISMDTKKDHLYFALQGKKVTTSFCDLMLAHYNISVSEKHDLQTLVDKYLPNMQTLIPWPEDITQVTLEDLAAYAGQRACLMYQLAEQIRPKLHEYGLEKVFFEIDNPLVRVLADMEKTGIMVNCDFFKSLEDEFSTQLNEIEKNIEKASGVSVNLKSPKQVSQLLFEKLNLPTVKKTKTGQSTDSEVLEVLKSLQLSDVPEMILRYRELDKLLSTYVQTLPKMINEKTRRVHTSFQQAVTSTGRLSSDHPNLQNIPVRTKNGRRIRKGFVAAPGKLLLSADYSQVELRLLAHFGKDKTMLKAFKEGHDIHARTASEVLGVDLDNVSYEERSRAKAVNFGLMYGQSSFGLARNLGISRAEARDYIANYFKEFQGVKVFLDELKDRCAQKGYAETLFGRKRFLPDIHSKNRNIKAAAERLAINTPIQGTAADIIKIAMIRIWKELGQRNLRSKMILQVHDELIFEVIEEELSEVKDIVVYNMENAAQLDVPLKVDVGIGVNWFDLK